MMNLASISVSGDVDRASKGFNYIPADHPGLERGIQSHQKCILRIVAHVSAFVSLES